MKRNFFKLKSLLFCNLLFAFLACEKEKPVANTESSFPERPEINEIVKTKCANCHYLKSKISRFNITNDVEFFGQMEAVLQRVENDSMPPVGHKQLTEIEKKRFVMWARENLKK